MLVLLGEEGALTAGTGESNSEGVMGEHERPCSCTLLSKASIRADVVEAPIDEVEGWTGAGISTCRTSS